MRSEPLLRPVTVALCACIVSACVVAPVPTKTTYDGAPRRSVNRAVSKAEFAALVGAPDLQTADGRFILYRFNAETEWELVVVVLDAGESFNLPGKGEKRVDLLIELDASNQIERRTTQTCASERRVTSCDASDETTLWALVAKLQGEVFAAEYRAAQADIAARGASLYAAAAAGDANAVSRLLAEGADARAERDGEAALHAAAARGHAAAVEALLSAGSAVDIRDSEARTPLAVAAAAGQMAMIELLLASGADPNVTDLGHGTALTGAVSNQHLDVVARLLAAGADPNADDGLMNTAVLTGNAALVQALIAAGADVRGSSKVTPLHVAAGRGDVAVAQLLIDAGADVNAKNTASVDETPLHAAAFNGHRAMVETLLAAGARVNATASGWDGNATPLHRAIVAGQLGAAEALLAHGADARAELRVYRRMSFSPAERLTPLELAMRGGNESIIALLTQHTPDAGTR